VPVKCWYLPSELRGTISQKTIKLMTDMSTGTKNISEYIHVIGLLSGFLKL